MALISWVSLRERTPVDISRIVSHANTFNSLVGVRINAGNLNRAKKSLIDARAELDLVFTALQQVLYDREILKSKVDEVLHGWLIDNIGRYQKVLDEREEELLIKFESSDVKLVGVARISSYAKSLKVAQQLIYESLLKATDEFYSIKDEEDIMKDKRTFLYILFQVLNVTMSSVGGVARVEKGLAGKKGQVGSLPTTWQSLLSNTGQSTIVKKHNAITGDKMEVPDFMTENSESPEEPEEEVETIFLEEDEENADP